jgi:hypothetical protein
VADALAIQPADRSLVRPEPDADSLLVASAALARQRPHPAGARGSTLHDLDIVEQKLADVGALRKQNAKVNTAVYDGKLLYEMGSGDRGVKPPRATSMRHQSAINAC